MEFAEFSQDFAKEVRLKWDLTDPCDELGQHKQIVLLPFLGKMRAFPRFDPYFHYKQVCVERKKASGVESLLPRLGLTEFLIL